MGGRIRRVVALCGVMAFVVACGASAEPSSAPAVRPTPAAVVEYPNPLRGQYEDLLLPLFPQGNAAQHGYPPWPGSFDASLRVSWRQLQPVDPSTLPAGAPDDVRYNFSAIDRALAEFGGRGLRLTLRVYSYNSCCNSNYPDNTNIAVPDWIRATPGSTTTLTGPQGAGTPITQVVPEWNDSAYLAGVEQLIAALGRRYDGDERLSVFEFSGYGDFSENHIAYLRDSLAAPGPAPEESEAVLGYYSQFRDQSITTASITRLAEANVSAFPRTQLVVTPQNPEIVRQLLDPEVTERSSAPVGIRSDCLGVLDPLPAWASDADSGYVTDKDPLVTALTQRLREAPMITEWCQLPDGGDRAAYYDKGLRDVVKYHVSMTSSANFSDRNATERMDPKLYAVWARANTFAGYRYSAQATGGQTPSAINGVVDVPVSWTNSGAAATTENWIPEYRLIDSAGAVARTLPANVQLRSLLGEPPEAAEEPVPATVVDPVRIDLSGLAPGRYTLAVAVIWQQHKRQASQVVNYPPMALAQEGRDASGWYRVASIDVPARR